MRQHSCEIVTIVNQKGGVGKTTTAINLATALAAVDKRVLLIDFDPQGNASTGLGVDTQSRHFSSYEMLISHCSVADATIDTAVPGLSIIPSRVDLSAVETELSDYPGREFILKKLLSSQQSLYDYIFIDCPPSLGLLTINSLTASHSLLIPLQCEFFALEGLGHLLYTISLIQERLNPALIVKGILLTMYDRRNRLTEQVEAEVRNYFKDQVFTTVIPRNVRMSEAPSHGMPALIYDHRCPGSRAYIELAKEILARTYAEIASTHATTTEHSSTSPQGEHAA